MSRTKFVKKLNKEIMAERNKDYEFNKPFIKDFIKDLEQTRDADKRFKWFDLNELIEVFIMYACKGNGTQLISFDRYFYKYGVIEEDVQSRIKKDIYWYKAKYFADLFSDTPKKAKSVWLKLYAFQLLNRIKDKYFKYDEKVHIDKLIEFLKEYENGK